MKRASVGRRVRRVRGLATILGGLLTGVACIWATAATPDELFGQQECELIAEFGIDAFAKEFAEYVFGTSNCGNSRTLEPGCSASLAKRTDYFGVSLSENQALPGFLPSGERPIEMLRNYAVRASNNTGVKLDEENVGGELKKISVVMIPVDLISVEMRSLIEEQITRPDLLLTDERRNIFENFMTNQDSYCVTFNLETTTDEIIHSQVWIKAPISEPAFKQCLQLGILTSFGLNNPEHLAKIVDAPASEFAPATFDAEAETMLRALYGLSVEPGMTRQQTQGYLESALRHRCLNQ